MSFNPPYNPGTQWEKPHLGSPAGAIATDRWSGASIIDNGIGGLSVHTPTISNTSTVLSSAVDGASLLGGTTFGSGLSTVGGGLGTLGSTLGVVNGLQADGNKFGPNTASAIGTMAVCGPIARSAAISGCEAGISAGAFAGPVGAGVGCLIGGTAAGVGAYKACETGVKSAVNSVFK